MFLGDLMIYVVDIGGSFLGVNDCYDVLMFLYIVDCVFVCISSIFFILGMFMGNILSIGVVVFIGLILFFVMLGVYGIMCFLMINMLKDSFGNVMFMNISSFVDLNFNIIVTLGVLSSFVFMNFLVMIYELEFGVMNMLMF